jgi:hypothetical protein
MDGMGLCRWQKISVRVWFGWLCTTPDNERREMQKYYYELTYVHVRTSRSRWKREKRRPYYAMICSALLCSTLLYSALLTLTKTRRKDYTRTMIQFHPSSKPPLQRTPRPGTNTKHTHRRPSLRRLPTHTLVRKLPSQEPPGRTFQLHRLVSPTTHIVQLLVL